MFVRRAKALLKGAIPPSVVTFRASGAGGEVALTFDDGPVLGFTDRVLDLLGRTRHRGTFFVEGRRAAQAGDLVRRIRDEGHEIGNHSYSHRRQSKLSLSDIHAEIVRTDEAVREAIGSPPRFFRPPFGELSLRVVWWIRRQRRGPIVLWSRGLGGDEKTFIRSGEDIRLELTRCEIQAGDILLLHDTNHGTVDGMAAVLEHLDQRSLRSVTLEALLGRRS